jgi:hypothetical protein
VTSTLNGKVNGSAYPIPVEQLLPKAQKLTEELGAVPSRNRLMTELKIGRDKANAVLAELLADDPTLPGVRDPFGEGNVDTPIEPSPLVEVVAAPGPDTGPASARTVHTWPVLLLALPAFVAVWSGWVGLGQLTGFGVIHPLPGIWDEVELDTAITLPIGVETYAAYALHVWLSGRAVSASARRFAKCSAIGALILGALGQVAYHLLVAAGVTSAPWQITTATACLPVAVLGMGAALAHLIRQDH